MVIKRFISSKKIRSRVAVDGLSAGQNLFRLVSIFPLVWLAAGLFVSYPVIRFILVLPVSLGLNLTYRRWWSNRQVNLERMQFKLFLEYLLTRLSAGSSLEKAINESPANLQILIGRKSYLLTQLQNAVQQIKSGHPLESVMADLGCQLRCREAQVVCHSLAPLRQTSSRLNHFVRQHLNMLIEKQSVMLDIESEQAQRRTEAYILCLMPYIMIFFTRQAFASYSENALELPAGQIGMLLSFTLAVTALLMTINMLHVSENNLFIPFEVRQQHRFWHYPGSRIKAFYTLVMPSIYVLQLFEIMQTQQLRLPDLGKSVDCQTEFFARKAKLIILAVPVGCTLSLSFGKIFLLFIPSLAVIILQDHQLINWAKQHTAASRQEYPILINLIAAFLQAGLSLHRALSLCTQVFHDDSMSVPGSGKAVLPMLHPEIYQLKQRLDMSWSGSMIMQEQADRCSIPEVRSALVLMARFEQTGGSQIIQLIEMQASACWNLQRNALRKQLEKQSLQLILPMVANLVSVLLIAIIPAVLSLYQI